MTDFHVLDDNPRYSVFSDGNIYDNHRSIFLHISKQELFKTGKFYPRVWLQDKRYRNEGHYMQVDRLVAKYFVKNNDPKNKHVVKHINGNNFDCHASNLYWSSKSHKQGKPILVYKKDTGEFVREFPSSRDLAKWLQDTKGAGRYCYSMVSYTLTGRRTSYYGYIFKYKNPAQKVDAFATPVKAGVKRPKQPILMYSAKSGKFIRQFDSISQASDWILKNTDSSIYGFNSVSRCLHGYQTVCYGYVFKYGKKKNDSIDSELIRRRKLKVKPVYKYDMNGNLVNTYKNMYYALQDDKHLLRGSLQSALSGAYKDNAPYIKRHNYHGYLWYYEQPTKEQLLAEFNSSHLAGYINRPVIVRDVGTGKIVKKFDQPKDVSTWLQKTKGAGKHALRSVLRCLLKKQAKYYDYTYDYDNEN